MTKPSEQTKIFSTLDQLRDAAEHGKQQHRRQLDERVAQIIDIADQIENEPELWQAFVEQPIWRTRRQRPRQRSEALRFNMVWAFGDRRRASKFFRAVQPLYTNPGLDGAGIVKSIRERGGYEAAARANSMAKASTSTAPRASPTQIRLVLASSADSEPLETADLGETVHVVLEIIARSGSVITAEVRAAEAEAA